MACEGNLTCQAVASSLEVFAAKSHAVVQSNHIRLKLLSAVAILFQSIEKTFSIQ